jgi:hypothetical protein
MKRLFLTLDGAFVLGLGLYMLILSQAESYAAFMNPRFRPLTAGAAVGLCLAAAAFILRPEGGIDLRRTMCFAILGVLALHAGSGSLKGTAGLALKPPPEARIEPDPHVVRDGVPYLKSNPARLFLTLQAGLAAPPDQRYITRGIVKRSPQLDRVGMFALLRGNMVCCLADAIAMGMMVAYAGGPPPQDGAWVLVQGYVQPLAEPSPITDLGGTSEAPFSMVYDRAHLVAESVEPIDRPGFPYVFELPASGRQPLRLTGGDDDY